MKQVFIKKGKAIVDEVPEPAISDDEVLVQVCYSCISTGTESYKIRASGRSLIKKAIDSPDNFKKVMQRVKTAGLKDALVKIKGKIEGKNPIGYSASGVVIDKGKNIKKLMKGQRVAVAGEGIANHAGFVAAPENLAVLIPEGVTLKQASTVALGSIALHSIRRCSPGTGEFATVIGLGCIGQLVSQIANVAGSRVIGIDIDNSRIERAKSLGLEFGIDASEQDCIKEVMTITGGYGSDHVLIAASSNDDSIINDSMKMCRKKGRIIIIGSVGLNIEREEFYRKELDLLISTSYGPGRYDNNYEGRQVDYPYSYVRWTENRNMDEYLRLLSKNKLLIEDLIEKIYKAEDAENAFDSLREGTMSPLITLLEYEKEPQRHRTSANEKYRPVKGNIKVGIIGAGGFTRDVHLPNLSKLKEFFSISAVCSKNGSSAAAVAEQYNAAYSTTDYQEILLDKDIDMVFIATRHNLHAPIAIEAVKSGKAVFLEKPMAINREELDILEGLIIKNQTPFMVGFNRRFSPFSVKIKDMISKRNGPMIIDYRVNAGYIQSDSWVHSEEGGGRNIGEACHFYDMFNYLTDSKVSTISAAGINPYADYSRANENFSVVLKYKDGTVCNLIYTSMGNIRIPKEEIDIYFDGKTIMLHDYTKLRVFGIKGKDIISKKQEKGYLEELKLFGNSIKDNKILIPIWQLVQATKISFEVEKQLSER